LLRKGCGGAKIMELTQTRLLERQCRRAIGLARTFLHNSWSINKLSRTEGSVEGEMSAARPLEGVKALLKSADKPLETLWVYKPMPSNDEAGWSRARTAFPCPWFFPLPLWGRVRVGANGASTNTGLSTTTAVGPYPTLPQRGRGKSDPFLRMIVAAQGFQSGSWGQRATRRREHG
jgi:hypothetical protein